MATTQRTIRITEPNLRNRTFYITRARALFPMDVFGGEEGRIASKQVIVRFGNERIETDIVKNMFRGRVLADRFYATQGILAGDSVVLEQISQYEYRLSRAK